jgi:sterol desaturase/sphingolipid hydroxylase (fatty acid hydroxylase superfamily)
MRVLPFVSGASYHDHHHSHNVGNYAGSCYIWDLLLGTNKEYMKQWLKKD